MDQNFEQNIPIPALIAGFIVLLIVSSVLRKWLRQRSLVRDGQISTEGGRIPTIAERVAGNKAWSRGEIFSKGRNFMIVLCVSALTWNLTIGVAFIKSLSNPAIKTAPLIVLGIFTLFGLVFAVFAVRSTMRYLRFGESRCCIQDKAGILGKTMTGVVRCNKEIEATGDYTIELLCVDTYYTGSGKNRRTQTTTHWQSKQQVSKVGRRASAGIPFSFALPPYPPETGYQLARGTVDWQLRIHAPVKGIDYAADFIVPVFKMDYTQ